MKKLANTVLNFRNEKAVKIPLYRLMRQKFPATFGVVEDIKRTDHRNISIPLRRYTAKSVEDALMHLQSGGIPVVPQTDALLCQRRHRETVCSAFGAAVFKVSRGVRCKVDGIRYEHPEHQQNKAFGRRPFPLSLYPPKQQKRFLGISSRQQHPLRSVAMTHHKMTKPQM